MSIILVNGLNGSSMKKSKFSLALEKLFFGKSRNELKIYYFIIDKTKWVEM
jgi:hypothetical protein